MLISKIISGGQTGVDRGAIEAALELGFPYGGLPTFSQRLFWWHDVKRRLAGKERRKA